MTNEFVNLAQYMNNGDNLVGVRLGGRDSGRENQGYYYYLPSIFTNLGQMFSNGNSVLPNFRYENIGWDGNRNNNSGGGF